MTTDTTTARVELTVYLADEDSEWIDELPIDGSRGTLDVTERSVDNVRILSTSSGT